MHERHVTRINKAKNRVVHIHVKNTADGKFWFIDFYAKIGWRKVWSAFKAGVAGHIDKHQPIGFMARVLADFDAAGVNIVLIIERGYQFTGPICPKAPAVVRALHARYAIGVDLAALRQWDAAMGANIAYREDFTARSAAQQNRLSQNHAPKLLAGFQLFGSRGKIPAISQQAVIGRDVVDQGD